MALLVASRSSRPAAPPPTSVVDLAHPLARELVQFVPLWLRAPAPNGPLYGHGSLAASATFQTPSGMLSVPSVAGSGYLAEASPASLAAPVAASWAVYANITSVASDFAALMQIRASNSYGVFARSTNNLGVSWAGDGTWNDVGMAFSLNRWQVLGASAKVGFMATASGSGYQAASSNLPTTSGVVAATTAWNVGWDPVSTPRVSVGLYAWAAVWRRTLSANEWAWLNAEPFAFVRPAAPRRQWVSVPASSSLVSVRSGGVWKTVTPQDRQGGAWAAKPVKVRRAGAWYP